MPRMKDKEKKKLQERKRAAEVLNPGSPLAWAMAQLNKHLRSNMDIRPIAEALRIDINEYGNIEVILELTPEIAIIVGEAMMAAGKRPNFLEDEDDSE